MSWEPSVWTWFLGINCEHKDAIWFTSLRDVYIDHFETQHGKLIFDRVIAIVRSHSNRLREKDFPESTINDILNTSFCNKYVIKFETRHQ